MDRARRGGSGALNPQSALAGLNSPPEGLPLRSLRRSGRRWFGSRAVSAREPGQVRKEAALSDPRQAQRELPDRSRGRRSATGRQPRRGVHGPLRARARRTRLGAALKDPPRAVARAPRVKPGGTLTGDVRVVRVEHVVFVRPRRSPGRRTAFADRLRGDLGADDVRRARLQVQREQRDRRVVGHADRSAARG